VESAPSVAAILLTMNQRDKTLRCLESFRSVEAGSLRIFLWDNGSEDGTSEAVRGRFPEVAIQASPANIGVAGGRNAAAKTAIVAMNPRFLLFLDNDMTVTPHFLAELLRPFADDALLAQTTGKIRIMGTQQIYGAGGCHVNFWFGRTSHVGHGEEDRGQYDQPEACIVSGGCMLVRTSVFQEFGGFDTRFNPYGPEDLDFGLRLRRAGYRALYVPGAIVYHEPVCGRTHTGGQYSQLYVQSKTRHWFRLLRTHASIGQQLGFALVGVPYLMVRATLRETRRGNLGALKGFLAGARDSLRKQD
jgi:GT2 family glycosyltransferase